MSAVVLLTEEQGRESSVCCGCGRSKPSGPKEEVVCWHCLSRSDNNLKASGLGFEDWQRRLPSFKRAVAAMEAFDEIERLKAEKRELLEALEAAIAIHRVQAETCRIEARSGVHPDHNVKYAAELDLHADHWESLVAKAQGGVK